MSNDLISRSAVIKIIEDELKLKSSYVEHNAQIDIMFKVKEMPIAYDVDKVVERLEQQKNQYFRRAEEIKNKFGENYESQKNYGKACSYDHAIEIVKSGGVE